MSKSKEELTILQVLALRKLKAYGDKCPDNRGWMNIDAVRLRMKMTTANSLVARGLIEVRDDCYRLNEEGSKLLAQEPGEAA